MAESAESKVGIFSFNQLSAAGTALLQVAGELEASPEKINSLVEFFPQLIHDAAGFPIWDRSRARLGFSLKQLRWELTSPNVWRRLPCGIFSTGSPAYCDRGPADSIGNGFAVKGGIFSTFFNGWCPTNRQPQRTRATARAF
jgi:hypothetical protein